MPLVCITGQVPQHLIGTDAFQEVKTTHIVETITKANIADPTKYLSHWPGNAGYGPGGALARPRSATIVITKNDGSVIGS